MNVTVLKIITGVMGVMILVGLAIIIATIIKRTAGIVGGSDAVVSKGGRIDLPQGAEVVEMTADGNLLYIRVQLPDGSHSILVHDRATGVMQDPILIAPAAQ